MNTFRIVLLFLLPYAALEAQQATLSGRLTDAAGEPLIYANVALFRLPDSSLQKAGLSQEGGRFQFQQLPAGNYFLKATYLGLEDFHRGDIVLGSETALDLEALRFSAGGVALSEVTVRANRALVEVKPDRTIFNVEGTINSVGNDALSLLRKAPAMMVDNNDNITMMGRSGVLVYVDGKRLPLAGEDLALYLQNLPAEQIDRIDIITSPGAKYEAEGNAGIIDIRMKKDQNTGANGTLNGNYSQGRYRRGLLNGSANYRNKRMNVFGSGGWADSKTFFKLTGLSYQNGLVLEEIMDNRNLNDNYNFRVGTDFFISPKHTIGILASANKTIGERPNYNRITVAKEATPLQYDSILVANGRSDYSRAQQTYNVNYRFDNSKGQTVNVDLDYGRYRNDTERYQPNRYYDASEQVLLTEIINSFDTPSDIDIYTFKTDFEDKVLGGRLGLGVKYSQVVSNNTFLFNDVLNGTPVQNDRRSNRFRYDEQVYAGYASYNRPLGKSWNFSAGLRAEQTDVKGNLNAFLPELQEPPVKLDYLNWFPSTGITYNLSENHSLALNYGRRINRPDYNVLNPFNNQNSQLSFEKGNPFLRPEIVNNLELGYTLAKRYNFKLAYSLTTDQITRLIGPDDEDPRANFITWDNLAQQTIVSFNASVPVQITKFWNAFFNATSSWMDNQADYGNGVTIDLQAFTYNIYQQHTFSLPWAFTGEVSGYYSGPGIWGGVFKYESNWSLDLGLQRRFLRDRLNVKLSASDLFYQTGFDGYSDFSGLLSYASGRWDSRRVTLSAGYNFGNENVKSRKRKTGLEEEAKRVGGD